MVLGEQPPGRPRRRHPARREAAVPADAYRARRRRRRRARQRPAWAAADAGSAPAARCAGGSGGAGDRAGQPGRGRRSRAPRGRDRAAALGAADLDLPRSPYAAGLDPRLGHQPRELPRIARRGGAGRAGRHDPGGSRAAQPLHRQSAGHDAARIRRDRSRSTSWSISPRSSAARSSAPARCSPSTAIEMDLAPGPADAAARCRAVRAGAVQSPGQCREICAARLARPHRGAARGRRGSTPGARRRRGNPARRLSSASSTSSTACRRPTAAAPAPGSASPSAAASSRRWAGPSSAGNRQDRRGAVFTITLPVPAEEGAARERDA